MSGFLAGRSPGLGDHSCRNLGERFGIRPVEERFGCRTNQRCLPFVGAYFLGNFDQPEFGVGGNFGQSFVPGCSRGHGPCSRLADIRPEDLVGILVGAGHPVEDIPVDSLAGGNLAVGTLAEENSVEGSLVGDSRPADTLAAGSLVGDSRLADTLEGGSLVGDSHRVD